MPSANERLVLRRIPLSHRLVLRSCRPTAGRARTPSGARWEFERIATVGEERHEPVREEAAATSRADARRLHREPSRSSDRRSAPRARHGEGPTPAGALSEHAEVTAFASDAVEVRDRFGGNIARVRTGRSSTPEHGDEVRERRAPSTEQASTCQRNPLVVPVGLPSRRHREAAATSDRLAPSGDGHTSARRHELRIADPHTEVTGEEADSARGPNGRYPYADPARRGGRGLAGLGRAHQRASAAGDLASDEIMSRQRALSIAGGKRNTTVAWRSGGRPGVHGLGRASGQCRTDVVRSETAMRPDD